MFLRRFLPYRLNALSEAFSAEIAPIYRRQYGMTRPEWRVLAHLAEAPEASAREVVELASLHKTKVSRALQALEKRGWVSRTVDPVDRRVSHSKLTPRGRQAFEKLKPAVTGAAEAMLGQLTEKERETVEVALALLERITALRPRRLD